MVSISETRGLAISLHSQEPARCKAVGGDVRTTSVPGHWAQQRPDKQFFCFALGSGFHFIEDFVRIYNFICEQHRLHINFI